MTPDDLFDRVADRFPDSACVVALSGGPDSAVLAWVAWRRGASFDLVHVNHGWPGSVLMEKAAHDVAAHLDRKLQVVHVSSGPTETEARSVRLTALQEAASGRLIATGHHRDDDVETVVGNLLRGAGATGLSGIGQVRLPFFRPLLDVARSDIRSVADACGLPYHDDQANDDVSHRRNRIRNLLLPELERMEPGLSERLLRTSQALAEDDAALEAQAAAVPVAAGRDGVSIPYGPLVTAPPAVAARIVRRALRLAHPPYPGSFADVEAVLGLERRGRAALGSGIDAIREGPFVVLIGHDHSERAPKPAALPVPGAIEFGRHRITSQAGVTARPVVGRNVAEISIEISDLIVRTPESGDRIDIAEGSKLVSDALTEARVPQRHRIGWPVVASRGRIVWIAGVRVAHWAAQGAASGEAVRLVAERL